MKKLIYLVLIVGSLIVHQAVAQKMSKASKSLIKQKFLKTATPERIRKLVDQGANVNDMNKRGKTVLMFVIQRSGKTEIISTLIELGADVKAKNKSGKTALMFAAAENVNFEAISILLKAGAEIVDKDNSDITVLMYAARGSQDPKVLSTFLEAGAKIKAKDISQRTVLMLAAERNPNVEIINALIKAGADVNARDSQHQTPLWHAAVNNPNVDITHALIKAGADVKVGNFPASKKPNSSTDSTATQKKKGFAKLMAEATTSDRSGGRTILMQAAIENENPEVITALIKAGADPNYRNNNMTILMAVAEKGEYPQNVAALLRGGAMAYVDKDGKKLHVPHVQVLDWYGRSAGPMIYAQKRIDLAGERGDDVAEEMIEILENARKIDFAVSGKNQGTPAKVRQIIEKGANVNEMGVDDRTPLMRAVLPEVFSILIEMGADVNKKEPKASKTPLIFAVQKNKGPEVVSILLKAGADVNAKTERPDIVEFASQETQDNRGIGAGIGMLQNEGKTVLMFAVDKKNPDPKVITLLLEAGADVNAKDKRQRTALMEAAKENATPEIITMLLKAGADIHHKDKRGRNILIISVRKNKSPQVISTLLEAGADPKHKDQDGKSALDWAKEKAEEDIVRMLEEKTKK